VECVNRLTAEHDPHAQLYGLLTRSLRALTGAATPPRVAVLLRRARAGRARPPAAPGPLRGVRARLSFPRPSLDEGGVVCERCAATPGATAISPAAVPRWGAARGALEEALARRSAASRRSCGGAGSTHDTTDRPADAYTKFLREVRRLFERPESRDETSCVKPRRATASPGRAERWGLGRKRGAPRLRRGAPAGGLGAISGPPARTMSAADHGRDRFAVQAARLRLPVQRDLRRHRLVLGLRPARRRAQEQHQARLVA